jgi:hypothetical protein
VHTRIVLILCVAGMTCMAQAGDVGNEIVHDPELGYSLTVYDHREETLRWMEERDLQGGGPTWMALIHAVLSLESPDTLASIEFDDEADMVLVTSDDRRVLEVVQTYVALLMSDERLRERCVSEAESSGYLE